MIKTTTKVRCDRCGRVIFTHEGDHEKVKDNFRAYGWTFTETSAYCKDCSKQMEDGEE